MKSFLSLQKFREDDTRVTTFNCQQRKEPFFSRKIHSGDRNRLSPVFVEWGGLRRVRAHRIKLDFYLYSIPLDLSQNCFFPTHSSRKMRQVIHEGSTVLYRRSSISPYFSSPTRRISDFLASSRESNLVRSFDVPLHSHRVFKLESPHEVVDYEFGIAALLFNYVNFFRF
ncbi:hypothetical protein AVEN_1696-1 [Araneus ventricosus]|uniref:Uncharacterized protein n=1 Tax=Araneus ventricosus TaxID=182803 RepID=A0A4Y2JXE8_ARAVE|nr:hypothetical protein AVEN_1696-1 [Araneus ventricosus]